MKYETQADITAQEVVDAYRVEYNGKTYTDVDPGSISGLLENLESGESILVSTIIMSRSAYDSLPEFSGF